MKYRDVLDGHLHVEQGKTGTRVRISHCTASYSDRNVDTGLHRSQPHTSRAFPVSPSPLQGRVEAGDPIRSNTLSREVASLIKQVGYQPRSGRLPPSLHEIRSLAARLWAEQHGPEFSQALLGHKSSDMTALYRDVRGAEWITVRVG